MKTAVQSELNLNFHCCRCCLEINFPSVGVSFFFFCLLICGLLAQLMSFHSSSTFFAACFTCAKCWNADPLSVSGADKESRRALSCNFKFSCLLTIIDMTGCFATVFFRQSHERHLALISLIQIEWSWSTQQKTQRGSRTKLSLLQFFLLIIHFQFLVNSSSSRCRSKSCWIKSSRVLFFLFRLWKDFFQFGAFIQPSAVTRSDFQFPITFFGFWCNRWLTDNQHFYNHAFGRTRWQTAQIPHHFGVGAVYRIWKKRAIQTIYVGTLIIRQEISKVSIARPE